MNNIPSYLIEDEAFYYCNKENIEELKQFEDFVPLSILLENSDVSNAYYNVIGQIYGKNVMVI